MLGMTRGSSSTSLKCSKIVDRERVRGYVSWPNGYLSFTKSYYQGAEDFEVSFGYKGAISLPSA